MKFFTITLQRLTSLLYYILCISLFLSASACTNSNHSPSGTGSVSFSVEWRGAPTKQPYEAGFRALDCDAAGVVSVEAHIFDENESYLTAGGPWLCSAHAGTIDNVPAGSNRKVVVSGKDSNGNLLYSGAVTGITVTAGQTTNAGTIVVEPYNSSLNPPSLTTPTDGETLTIGNPTFEWNPVNGASEYVILVSTESTFSSTEVNETVTTASYTSNTTLSNGTYYWKVRAKDNEGVGSLWSEVWSFTINTTGQTTPDSTNSLGMTFNLIPAGIFTMGSPSDEPGRDNDETQHQVTLSQSFYMQTTELTQAQWTAVMGSNPSYFSGCSDCPVEQVSWDDVQTFITELNTWGEGAYRLPTEAEWEYAARAGTTTAFANGDISVTDCSYDPNLDVMGWYCYNSSSTQSVAQKNPNAWGLYDMHGNVVEWCQDWYGAYTSGPVTDPTGPPSGSSLVIRGGSWEIGASTCRSAYRFTKTSSGGHWDMGFRLAITLPKLPDTGQTQSYTNTFGEDSDYSINPPSYTDNGDGTITDNVTGLMWQKEDDDITRTWDNANSYCNDITIAGYSNWRLPSKKELISVLDCGTYSPSIDTTYFTGTNASNYWSFTTGANSSSLAWLVDFNSGLVDGRNKSNSYYVQCVRGQELNFGNFNDNGDGAVTDNNTGLMWQQDESGQNTWEDAILYCEGLSLAGHTDWRLPNIKELESITDDIVYSPAIDTNFFPYANAFYYWSSTTYAGNSSDAWPVDFSNGNVYYNVKLMSYNVRCVRAGQ